MLPQILSRNLHALQTSVESAEFALAKDGENIVSSIHTKDDKGIDFNSTSFLEIQQKYAKKKNSLNMMEVEGSRRTNSPIARQNKNKIAPLKLEAMENVTMK